MTLSLLACGKPTHVHKIQGRIPSAKAARKQIRLRHLRFSSDEEKARWERAIEVVWKTPLGEMFTEYVFTPTEDHADLPLWAQMLTERILREPHFVHTRRAAIRLMKDDLYVSERMTDDAGDRIAMLDDHIDRQQNMNELRGNGVRSFAVDALGSLTLAVAAPALQSITKTEARGLVNRVRRRAPYPAGYSRSAELRQIGSMRIGQILTNATVIYAAFPFAKWLWDTVKRTPGLGPTDQELLLGLDALVNATDLMAEDVTRLIPTKSPPVQNHPSAKNIEARGH